MEKVLVLSLVLVNSIICNFLQVICFTLRIEFDVHIGFLVLIGNEYLILLSLIIDF